jgi:Holliday junction resolvase RusA-like endonuclease
VNNAPVSFDVYGTPTPQGSKVAYGRRVVDANAERLKPWRESVKQAALTACEGRLPLEGPLDVAVTFYLPRPASAPKRVIWPAKKPDVDKLLRAAMDGMTDGGVWGDDAQVVRVVATKRFAGDGTGLQIPGMSVSVLPR